jgi:hypothetical protein
MWQVPTLDERAIPITVRYATRLRRLRGAGEGMTTIHVTDPGSGSVEDLVGLLEASGCVVERIGPNSIRISSGWPVRDEAAAYELDGYLMIFESTHPGVRAERAG